MALDRIALPLIASAIMFVTFMLAAVALHAQPQTDADRIQAETRRIEQEREQRFQDQQRERRDEAERQDQRRQQELRQLERTPPSSRPTPLLPPK
jgi:Ni/Co efflux regulator RcnB